MATVTDTLYTRCRTWKFHSHVHETAVAALDQLCTLPPQKGAPAKYKPHIF